MLRKRVKYPTGWTLLDENIKDVERVCLDPETQRKLCCTVGEYVFLEYPWVYVPRDDVLKLSNEVGSCLEAYREKISTYNGTSFLFGYNSTELSSDKFVICLTEEARDVIFQRNKNISKAILNGIREQREKIPKFWKSLGSEDDLESSAKNTRELYEIEINLPTTLLGLDRQLSDRDSGGSRDSYIDLIPDVNETFDNIDKLLVSRATQTHFLPRENYVQTQPRNPKNACTQYVYEDTLNGKLFDLKDSENVEKSCDETEQSIDSKEELEERKDKEIETEISREKEPIELFLEKHSQRMIDEIKYNAVVNVYVDDIKSLRNNISDISWHPKIIDFVVVSYIGSSNIIPTSNSNPGALLWSLSDTLRPQSYLRSNENVHCISFCPSRENIVIAGCESGQLVVWNIPLEIINSESTMSNNSKSKVLLDQQDIPIINVTATSKNDSSHRLPIRKIKWIPTKFQIKPNGKLMESLDDVGTCQFMTISVDGIIVIWTLDLSLNLSNDFLKVTYRFSVPIPNNSRNFTLLCVSISSESLQEECNNAHRKVNESDRKEEEYTRRLWLGTGEGELVRCTWKDQMFDVEPSSSEECNFLDRSFAHDGPVIEIVRCHRLLDVILTMGGHVFAMWNENYLESPIFWRRSKVIYTACCWSCQPGIFLMGRYDGELEMWDIKRKTGEPVFIRNISDGPLTVLSFWKATKESPGLIGIGDHRGIFRVFKEPAKYLDDDERMDWFEEYVSREVKRKKVFSSWQSEFLRNDPSVIARRSEKEDQERKRKLKEAKENLQKEHERRLKLQAEKKARNAPKSKETIWRLKEQKRMRSVLLNKKGFVPEELERRKLPLVRLQEEKRLKLQKIEKEINLREKSYEDIVARQIPEISNSFQRTTKIDEKINEVEEELETSIEKYMQQYRNIRDEVRKGLGIICMACVSPALVGASHWFLFVATTSFIATLLWCFIYLLSIREALKIPINWILTELLNTSVEAVLYMIAFIAQLSLWSSISNAPYIASNIAGGVFGILNTLAYAAGAYFLYIEWKSTEKKERVKTSPVSS
ncbi:dynein axonemal intermediate chain 3-like [Vespula squamosa]|uniref:Dynein axonemal intermediate chain 3-like n=1 Tax=Vespula squamosa TaxID=30214 RepID=A0ABD2AD03_VESSQ